MTALGVANDGVRIISGGSDNQVRVWHIGTGSQTMEATLNEHKGVCMCACSWDRMMTFVRSMHNCTKVSCGVSHVFLDCVCLGCMWRLESRFVLH